MQPVTEHYVWQAECRVIAGDDGACLTAILGSCVAACLWDPAARVGGMNHFLLPRRNGGGALTAMSAGSTAMEVLVAECLAAGASRAGLQAGLFGGGRVVQLLSDIGARNVAFARAFLDAEGIPVVSEGVGGSRARRIYFWPCTGAVRQRLVVDPAGEALAGDGKPCGAAEGSR